MLQEASRIWLDQRRATLMTSGLAQRLETPLPRASFGHKGAVGADGSGRVLLWSLLQNACHFESSCQAPAGFGGVHVGQVHVQIPECARASITSEGSDLDWLDRH